MKDAIIGNLGNFPVIYLPHCWEFMGSSRNIFPIFEDRNFGHDRHSRRHIISMASSLRQKKSLAVQSLPRRQSIHPGSNDAPAGSLPRVRPKDKSKVESLMKRRYSTRGVPVLPSIDEPFPSELTAKSKALTTGASDKVWLLSVYLTCEEV
jgi:hypothetical protein